MSRFARALVSAWPTWSHYWYRGKWSGAWQCCFKRCSVGFDFVLYEREWIVQVAFLCFLVRLARHRPGRGA